ncbi:MAG: ABC transporter ATP-binding protein [Bacilli bacterium]|nr:ABC transporter ATP-binding protein [Bacilli bacterium]
MLVIDRLTKYYGKTLAVNNLSFSVKPGEIFGLIGPNGAGKSTTIRSILKLININNGSIMIDGIDINDSQDYKNNIGYLPSEVSLYPEMTVKQIFAYSDSFYEKECLNRAYLLSQELDINLSKKIEDLSFGNLKKVGIVLAMMHEPKLLILDEPTTGLDPLKQEVFLDLLKEEKKKGTTILFSSHNLNEVKKICDRVGILREGVLVDIEEVSNLVLNDFVIVTIFGDYSKMNFVKNVIAKNGKMVKFIYRGETSELIKNLNLFVFDKVLIEEPSLEEIFMHYYRGEDND